MDNLITTRQQLVKCVSELVEEAYNLGYKDGREDAENKHKLHVMNVLKHELEKH